MSDQRHWIPDGYLAPADGDEQYEAQHTPGPALIAAAPVMRDALLGLLDWYDMDEGDLRPLMTAARHALAGVESDGKQREA